MFLKPKILVTFYKKMRQGDLPQFVRSVLLKMENNPTYANLTEVLTQLKTDLETYVNALAAAEDGGKQKTADKDLAKEALINTLDELSDGIEFFGKKDLSYFIGTGMPLQSKHTNHSGTHLLIPTDFTAKSNGQPGGIEVNYKIDPSQKSLCKMVGFEWSLDQENWFNGDYSTKQKFEVANKPSNQKVFVKIRAIAGDGRKSEWTEPVQTSVL
jgi:hypothetical protein